MGSLLCGYVLNPQSGTARRLQGRRGTEGPLWQHPAAAGDRFVRHAKEFVDRLTYLHLNPVGKGLAKLEDWPWSSDDNFPLDANRVRGGPIRIDVVRLGGSDRRNVLFPGDQGWRRL